MIKWNTLIILYIKTCRQYYLLKQLYRNTIRNVSNFMFQMDAETGVVGGEFSFSSSSLSRIGFPVEPPISKSSNAVGEKGVWMPGLKTASTSGCSFSQQNSTSYRSYTWYPFMSISCAPTLESISSLISCVSCRLGVTGTRARWLFTKTCLWGNNQLQAARENSRKLIVSSWTRSFTVRVTESGPNLRDHSMHLLETEKIMLLYCRLKVYRMKIEKNFWLPVSTDEKRHNYAIKGRIIAFFGSRSGVIKSDWRRYFYKERISFFFFVITTRLFDMAMCRIPPSNIIVGLQTLKGIFKTKQRALHFLQS